MELRLRLKRSLPEAGLEPGTARPAGQRLTHRATEAPIFFLGLLPFMTVASRGYHHFHLRANHFNNQGSRQRRATLPVRTYAGAY